MLKIKIAKNLAKKALQLVDPKKKICFVSDKKIWRNTKKFFSSDFLKNIDKLLILENPAPDEKNLQQIKNAVKNCNLIIALGSGTINDLCKFISFKTKIPYIIFISAPSMNGYASKNASLFQGKYKITRPATLPIAIYGDLGILKSAPKKMIKAGIGDSMCFYGCWFDWLLSHLILKTKFNKKPFTILTKKMDFLVKNYSKFHLEDEKFLQILVEILLLSGQGMTIAGGSYPASQSEHLIAHSFEMKYDTKILHGLQIAETSLTTARIQKKLLLQEKIRINHEKFPQIKLENFFGKEISDSCKKEYAKKLCFDLDQVNLELESEWKKHRQILQKIFFPAEDIQRIFDHFKIKYSHNESGKNFGISKAEYAKLVKNAKFIRNRFTCLDLAYTKSHL